MGWKFEVAKMFMYVSFPVGIFYYFNQPSNFEEWVIQTKKQYFPLQSKQMYEQMDNFIYEFNQTAQKKSLEEIERKRKENQ